MIDEIDSFIILFCSHLSEINEKTKQEHQAINCWYVIKKDDDRKVLRIDIMNKIQEDQIHLTYQQIASLAGGLSGEDYAYAVNSSIISEVISAGESDAPKIKYTRVYSKSYIGARK